MLFDSRDCEKLDPRRFELTTYRQWSNTSISSFQRLPANALSLVDQLLVACRWISFKLERFSFHLPSLVAAETVHARYIGPCLALTTELLDVICGGPLRDSKPDIRTEIRERRLRVASRRWAAPGEFHRLNGEKRPKAVVRYKVVQKRVTWPAS